MNEMSQQTQQLITRREIAALAGVRPSAVTNWISRHRDTFPVSSDGTHFDAEAVRAWLVAQGRMPAAPAVAEGDPAQAATRLLALVRADLDPLDAAGFAATVLTMHHLGGGVKAATAIEAAQALEFAGEVRPRALTAVLDALPPETVESEGLWREASAVVAAAQSAHTPLAEVFDAVLASAASTGRFVAEHYTPASLAAFVAELLPADYTSVLDPTCGFGGLLVTAAQRDGYFRKAKGLDVDDTAWALSAQNAIIHGLDNAKVTQADALTWLPTSQEHFDAVVSQPPIGAVVSDDSPAQVWSRAEVGKGVRRADLLWVMLAQRMLTEQGTAVVITGAGSLFTGGVEERMRSELLRSQSVEAIISLPAGHVIGTGAGAAIWVVRPAGRGRRDVLMVDLTSEAVTDPQGFIEQLTWLRAGDERFQTEPGTTALVPVLELLGDSVNLTPRLWVQAPADAEESAAAALAEFQKVAAAVSSPDLTASPPELALTPGAPAEMKRLSQFQALGLLEVHRGRALRRDTERDEEAEAVYSGVTADGRLHGGWTVAEVPPTALRTQPGDVVLQSAGQVRAMVDSEGGHLIADPLWLIRPRPDDPRVAPELLAMLLSSPRVGQLAVGAGIRRLRLADVTLPLLDPEQAQRLATVARHLQATEAAAANIVTASASCSHALVRAVESGVLIDVPHDVAPLNYAGPQEGFE